MTMTNELTNNYRNYFKLHAKARKAEGMPSPDLLRDINECWEEMTTFEQEYANWVNSLYANNIQWGRVIEQIKILARYLKDTDSVSEEELEKCKPQGKRWWSKDKRFTRLCALRAARRGRLHFSPTSHADQLWGRFQIPKGYPSVAPEAIDLAVQKEWVEPLAEEFYA